jgi:MFS transporter, DHA2 family, multidrug resistance protein
MPSALAVVAGSMLAPAIARRICPAYVIAAGLAIAAVGFLVLTQVDSSSGLPALVVGFVIASFGIGPTGALGTNLVVGSAPPEKAGSASSISETVGEFGIALGVAAFGSLGTAVYRNQIAASIPADVLAAAPEVARDTLAGATAAADELPDQLGTALLDPAREAFTSGLNVVAGLSAAAVVAFGVLAVILLRHIRPSGEAQPDLKEVPVQASD